MWPAGLERPERCGLCAGGAQPTTGRAFDPTITVHEASYTCDSCGEEIVIPVDPSAGAEQQYVEDCPVCCCPNVIRVEIDPDGARASASAE